MKFTSFILPCRREQGGLLKDKRDNLSVILSTFFSHQVLNVSSQLASMKKKSFKADCKIQAFDLLS